jgi:hypothetical protein
MVPSGFTGEARAANDETSFQDDHLKCEENTMVAQQLKSERVPADYQDDGYTPTPSEIARECAKIRRGWSEAEYRKRAALGPRRWMLPVVAVAERLS